MTLLFDQSIEWMTKGQAIVLKINGLRYNKFIFRQQSPFLWQKTGPLHLVLVGLTAGRLTDTAQLDFKILYRLNYFDFYFVYSSVINSVRSAFQSAFLKAYFRMCFVMCKLWSPSFSCWSLLLGISVPNDMY